MSLFSTPIFTELVLPFLLVFVILFAILQKSEILGKGKAQIDALVSLAIGLILIAVPTPRDIIVRMIPWLAVAVVAIFVFLVLYSFGGGKIDDTKDKWMKVVFGILAGVFIISLIIWSTGLWPSVKSSFGESGVLTNIFMIAIIAGAIAVALGTGKSGNDKLEKG